MTKSKILLIEPKFPRLYPGQDLFILQPSLGLLVLASVLEKNGFEVKIVNLKVETDFDLKECFAVGITGHAVQHKEIVKTAKRIKSEREDLPVILGGPHATFSADFILKQIKEIDFIIRNEGDFSFNMLLKNINNLEILYSIPGLSFRKDKKVIHNPSKQVQELDLLQIPSFHHIKPDKYFEKIDKASKEFGVKNFSLSIGLEGSRGCPAKCVFCSSRLMLNPDWRVKKQERIIEEMKILQNHLKPWLNRIDIDFIDNTFNASKKWLIVLCRLMRENRITFKWRCFCRAGQVDEELVGEMADSGCIGVFIGAEAADDESLKKMKKGIILNSVDQTVRTFSSYNIQTIVSFMAGFPWEKKEDVLKTLKTAIAFQDISPIVEGKIFKPTPYPGTSFWKTLEEKQLLKNKERDLNIEEVDEFDISRRKGLTFKHPLIKESDLDAMIVWFYLKTVVQNIIFLTEEKFKKYEKGVVLRLKMISGLVKTLGSQERFETQIAGIEGLINSPEKDKAIALDKVLDKILDSIL